MRIMSVVGARPQFVKLAPMDAEFAARGIDHIIVHTGQHYDHVMSDSFFDDLGIAQPDFRLAVGSSTHGRQTGEMMIGLEEVMESTRPDWVLVYGDTNSTVAAALCAVKLGIPLAHVESGLRSFNRRMPEEHNRVLTDHCADILFAPTALALENLRREGLADRTVVVGDVGTDVLYRMRDSVKNSPSPIHNDQGEYVIATIHRPQNTDDPERLRKIIDALSQLDKPVYVLAHPRLRKQVAELSMDHDRGSLVWRDPLSYPELVRAALTAAAIVTDSGGLQKEAFLMRVPCVTVRTETEWGETVNLGWNTLVEPGPDLVAAVANARPGLSEGMPYGDGDAAPKVTQILVESAIAHVR